jgi:hypothetical protein
MQILHSVFSCSTCLWLKLLLLLRLCGFACRNLCGASFVAAGCLCCWWLGSSMQSLQESSAACLRGSGRALLPCQQQQQQRLEQQQEQHQQPLARMISKVLG